MLLLITETGRRKLYPNAFSPHLERRVVTVTIASHVPGSQIGSPKSEGRPHDLVYGRAGLHHCENVLLFKDWNKGAQLTFVFLRQRDRLR